MISLDRQHVRAQIRHSLHHYWLLEGGLSGGEEFVGLERMVPLFYNESQSDVDDSPVNNKYKKGEGYHTVPPPYIRNYLPPRTDLSFAGLDDSVYRSGISKSQANETVVKPIKAETNKDSDSDEDEIVLKSVNEKHTNEKAEQPRKYSQSPRNDRKN
ncbi:hypothetical protein Tco_0780358 [Tanacetum coccineum]